MLLVTLLTMVLFFMIALILPAQGGWALYTLTAMFLLFASYPFGYFRNIFRTKYNVKAPVFIICFCAPSLIASAVVNLIYDPELIGNLGVFSTEALLRFWLIITAVTTLWTAVHAGAAAYKRHMDNKA